MVRTATTPGSATGDRARRHGYGQLMTVPSYLLNPIGRVTSPLRDADQAPKQGIEGGPEVWLDFDAEVTAGLADVESGDELVVLTWLHLAQRDVLSVHPRGDQHRPERGVFSTRSPHRPNPIGLHRVTVIEVAPGRLRVAPLEAIDGTPILDVKPVRAHTPDD